MRHRAVSLCLSLLLAACSKGGVISSPDTGETAAPPVDSDPPDSTPPEDSDPPPVDRHPPAPVETADTGEGTEVVDPPPEPEVSFSPAGGGFGEAFALTLGGGVDDAQLYYTVNGDAPACGEGTLYAGPVTLDQTSVVRAISCSALGESEVAAQVYLRVAPDAADFSSDIPVMVLYTEDAAPSSRDDDYTTFALNVFEPGKDRAAIVGEATLSTPAGLKVRGSSSSGYPKHPYTLELWGAASADDRDLELLGMPAESDWVLYAPLNFDRALMRNALIYRLSNEVDRYASRTAFAEVFVTERGAAVTLDDYVGVYVVTERVKRGEERVDITNLGPDDLESPEITGGYIFKHDRLGTSESGFSAGTVGGIFSFTLPMAYVDPEEGEIAPEQAAYLSAAIDEFALALAVPDFTHPETGAHYSELLDTGAFIDHHILNVFPKNPDAFRLSGYYFKDREGPFQAGPIWDFDRTMGCASDSRAEDPTWWDASNFTSDTTYVWDYGWYAGLFEDPEFRAAYWARWEELLDGPLSVKNVHAIVDEMAAELDEAADRNFDRWRDYPPRGTGDFDYEVQLLKDWLEERHDWIAGCIADDPRDCRGD